MGRFLYFIISVIFLAPAFLQPYVAGKFEFINFLRFVNSSRSWEVSSGNDAIAYSPNGKMLAVAGGKYTRSNISGNYSPQGYSQVEIRRVADGSLVKSWDFFAAQSLVFSPDNSMIAAGSYGGKVSVWRISDGELLHSFERISEHYANAKLLVFTPDGNNLMVFTLKPFKSESSPNNIVSVWNLPSETNRIISGEFISAALSPNGKILALGNRNKTIDLYRLDDLTLVKQLEVNRKPRFTLKFSPDGKQIAFVGNSPPAPPEDRYGYNIYLHSVEDGSLLNIFYHSTIFSENEESLKTFAISPDGRYLAASYSRSVPSSFFVGAPRASKAGIYGRIRVWRIEDGKQLTTLRGHKYRTYGLVFSPDSKFLVSTGGDGKVRFWKMPPRNYSWLWLLGVGGLAVLIYWRRTELMGLINQ